MQNAGDSGHGSKICEMKPYLLIIALGMALLLNTGCRTYAEKNTAAGPWASGNYPLAAKEYESLADKNKNGKDAIIWRLEHATALRALGQFKESNDAFQLAENKINEYEQKAKTRVGQEAAALFSNQASLAYEGRTYDKVMLNTYKALNFLQQGKPDEARTELIRTYQRQQDAVADNRKRLEKEQAELDKQKASDIQATERAKSDPKVSAKLQEASQALNSMSLYADYVNPFSVYLDGLFFMYQAADSSDLERASQSLARAAEMAKGNKCVLQDQETLKQIMSGQPVQPITYVIFESGRAPIRDQIRIDIPILVTRVSYIGAAFPKFVPMGSSMSALTVTGGGLAENTSTVCNMDAVIGHEFKNEMPSVITKTIMAMVIKGTAAYAINKGAGDQDALAGLFAQLVTAGYQAAVNIADLRTWTTLPKEFQICRIPTPPDRKLQVFIPSSGHRTDVQLMPGTVNVVFARAVSSVAPLIITQGVLK
jgi:hypothetical protein